MHQLTNENGGPIFRLRSTDALLGTHEELRRQEIYFGRPSELNDPVEGFTDVSWLGDQILWGNLIRHYLLCLSWYATYWLISTVEEYEPGPIWGRLTVADLPTNDYKRLYADVCEEFGRALNIDEASKLLSSLDAPLRREGLRAVLTLIHPVAASCLMQTFRERGLSEVSLPSLGNPESVMQVLVAMRELGSDGDLPDIPLTDQLETVGQVVNQLHDQMQLSLQSHSPTPNANKWNDLLTTFPQRYVDAAIGDLHFPPWRTACFTQTCTNASIWGTYADGHKGAALVFRPSYEGEKRRLMLSGLIGSSGQARPFEFLPVDYRDQPPAIDFFRTMGRLPMAKIRDTWFTNSAGQVSPRFNEIFGDEEQWRTDYWRKAMNVATWKLRDWQHEKEERLVATTPFDDDPAPQPLKYQFSQLEGIVFGMRTSMDDKLEIAKFIEEKCQAENRQDFRFFQCFYSGTKASLDTKELTLLSFDADS